MNTALSNEITRGQVFQEVNRNFIFENFEIVKRSNWMTSIKNLTVPSITATLAFWRVNRRVRWWAWTRAFTLGSIFLIGKFKRKVFKYFPLFLDLRDLFRSSVTALSESINDSFSVFFSSRRLLRLSRDERSRRARGERERRRGVRDLERRRGGGLWERSCLTSARRRRS